MKLIKKLTDKIDERNAARLRGAYARNREEARLLYENSSALSRSELTRAITLLDDPGTCKYDKPLQVFTPETIFIGISTGVTILGLSVLDHYADLWQTESLAAGVSATIATGIGLADQRASQYYSRREFYGLVKNSLTNSLGVKFRKIDKSLEPYVLSQGAD